MSRAVGTRSRRGVAAGAIFQVLFFIITFLFFLGVTKKWALVKSPPDGLTTETEAGGQVGGRASRMNLLFLGVDSVEGTHRTDTLFLLGIAPQERKVSILSVPRDTRVVVNGVGRKINEVLPRFGEYVLRSMIENLMEIRINRTVKVDFQGFVNIIDMMGGVDLEIEHAMNYDDNWGKVHIHFEKGPAHLDGQKALEFVRFRADANADLGRIKRQQKFLAAVLGKLQTPSMVVRLPMIIAEGLRHVQTDLSVAEALEMVNSLRGGGISVQTMSLPGEAVYIDKISFIKPYKDQAISIGAKHFSNLLVLELDASFTPGLSSGTSFPTEAAENSSGPALLQVPPVSGSGTNP